ncbi:hypothetical protein L7F22_065387 [Adiantum nelumboides]|nr:hypothetical protein [Adiantum nelumboides]
MGQALKKLGGGRSSSRIVPHKTHQQPAESRFQDPTLRGHLPGDVHPDPPYPDAIPQDQEREWDRSSLMYSKMVKELAGSVTTKQAGEDVQEHTYSRRPLPRARNTTNTGFGEDSSVPPGKLNLAQIRQVFLSYQGLVKGEKPMSAEALAKKYNVDVVLLERVLRLHTIQDKKVDRQTAGQDNHVQKEE